MYEGINLWGDINVCIVGDFSCVKFQFFKYELIICLFRIFKFLKLLFDVIKFY